MFCFWHDGLLFCATDAARIFLKPPVVSSFCVYIRIEPSQISIKDSMFLKRRRRVVFVER